MNKIFKKSLAIKLGLMYTVFIKCENKFKEKHHEIDFY
jgi:hypothetical protein